MADKNITLKRKTSSGTDNLYPSTTWGQIDSSTIPSTFTPTSHTHGNINDDGRINTSAIIATGDHLIIADHSSSNDLTGSSITFDTSNSTDFLRKDGTFATPAGTTFNGGTITNDLNITNEKTILMSGDYYINKKFDMLENASPQYILLCASGQNNEVMGTIHINRSTSNWQAATLEIVVSSRSNAAVQGAALRTLQVLQSGERYDIVYATYSGTQYIAVRYSGNVYPETVARFTGRMKSTGSAALLTVVGSSDVTGVNEFDGTTYSSLDVDTMHFRGNVGIGTTSPGEKLEVEGSGTTRLAVTSTGGATVKLKAASGNGYLGTSTNSSLRFQINDSDQMMLDTSGRLGIGTTSPSYKLDVNGTANFSGQVTIDTGTSNNALYIKGEQPTITFADDTSSADDFFIHINGNNFYVLTDRDGGNQIGVGYETPHPLQLEADTNTAYVFGSKVITDTTSTQNLNGDINMGANTIDFNANSGNSTTAQIIGDRSGTDLDTRNFTTEGGFSYTTFNGTTSNKPGGSFNNANGLLTMNTHSGAYNWQLAFVNTQGKMYARYRNGGSFQSWNEILTSASGYATESYVDTEIANLVASAPSTLDTLNELAAALGDDANFSTTVTNSLAGKLNLTGGTLTGTLTTRAINTSNYNITGVGALQFNDPGPNEGINWSGGNFSIYESPDNLTTNSAGNLQFVSGGTRRMTIGTDGYVYVGSTLHAPTSVTSAKVHITATNPILQLTDLNTSGSAYIDYQGGTSLKVHAGGDALTFVAGNAERARIASNGKMGLGTIAPGAMLHIVDSTSGSDLAKFRNNTDTADVTIKTSGEVGIVKGGAGDQLQLSANGTDNNGIRITTAGDVGVGTTSPTTKMHIAESGTGIALMVQNASSNGTVLQLNSTGDNRNLYLQTDHVYSNGALYLGDGSYNTIIRGNELLVEANVRTQGHLYLNYDNTATDGYVYFGDSASDTAHYLKFEHGNQRFNMSNALRIADYIHASGNFITNQNLYLNYDNTADDAYIYFGDQSSDTAHWLRFDESAQQFGFTNRVVASNGRLGAIESNGSDVDKVNFSLSGTTLTITTS